MFPRSVEIGAGVAAVAVGGAAAYALSQQKAPEVTEKYMSGEDYAAPTKRAQNFFADPKGITLALIKDLAAVGEVKSFSQLYPLIQDLLKKGEPLDDKRGTTEELISILCCLPDGSETRARLTNKLIDTLWDTLQHPPLSYVSGDVKYQVVNHKDPASAEAPEYIEFDAPNGSCKLREQLPASPDGIYKYRTPDGSYNSVLNPDLGRAGTPYARSIRPDKRLHGVKPDASLLFDLLMARTDTSFVENPAGISSILFYHASIIIHDIFRTNRLNANISDTSSYLDLAPLYGSSLKDQLKIRTMQGGKLKPDTFHESRLLGQPPGVNVILILYSRFHNYVADVLLNINENDRFSLTVTDKTPNATPEDIAKAIAKQDHDLFNTARLVVGGMYVNISLHDYIRAITNAHHSDTTWTLDPRVEMDKVFDDGGVPRGVGNQVSVEFNLLYRFHSCISKKDAKWIDEFFASLFPDKSKKFEDMTPQDLGMALQQFEMSIDKDPSKRTFGNLKRQADGTFADEDLVDILKESMEDPAGTFGARMVPKALKAVEVLAITQARRWGVASLNEFRSFFGLKPHQTFTDINSDEQIAKVLENLYTHPDMVEMYPGIMIENFKPAMNPGCGICPTYSVGRAILSDAVTLVRSDRFNTIDYSPANMTAWGYSEVKQDYKTLGGSMFYKLIQRAVPGWFPYNSLHSMQPMFTHKANQAIMTELGRIRQYTLEGPKKPRSTNIVATNSGIKQVLGDTKGFAVPWLKNMNDMFPGVKDYSWYMLSGDQAQNTKDRVLTQKVFGDLSNLVETLYDYVANVGTELLVGQAFEMSKGLYQIDIIRDVAVPLNGRLMGDLLFFDVKSKENPNGSLADVELYEHLYNIRVWGLNNTDPAMSWNRRRWAQEGVEAIYPSTRKLVQSIADERSSKIGSFFTNLIHGNATANIQEGSLRAKGADFVRGLLAAGKSADNVVDSLWLTGFGASGTLATAFSEVMGFFLLAENAQHWAKVQDFASKGDLKSIRAYVWEALRLSTDSRNVRVATQPATVDGQAIAPGNLVVMLFGTAGRNAKEVPNADQFRPDRKQDWLSAFSFGPHSCFGREVALAFVVGLVKIVAGLQGLHAAPGKMGQLRTIFVKSQKLFLNDTWSSLTIAPETWKLHYTGYGKGTYKPPKVATAAAQMNIDKIEFLLRKRKAAQAGDPDKWD